MQSIPAQGPVVQTATQTLSLANAPQAVLGAAQDLGGYFTFFSCGFVTTGTFTTGTAQLQGSVDGSTWFNMGTATAITTSNFFLNSGTTVSGPFRAVRINLTVAVTGGGVITSITFGAAGA